MQSKSSSRPPVEMKKKVMISVLFIFACAICISGVFFSVYSLLNRITFQVINAQVPGVLFGLAVLYLGIRYLISLNNLRKEVYKPTSRFSWDNFKKESRAKHKRQRIK